MDDSPVRWAELRPDEFCARRDHFPLVYLPMGLCEPHGHIAALGLDTIKADYYCEEVAKRIGGIVAPTQGYHIHECGFHAPWLEEVVGEHNPLLGGLPPHVTAYQLLYQLRAFANAGFKAIIAVSGHAGKSPDDLRHVAEAFTHHTGVPVILKADPEWVEGRFEGDHAGKYEISQLLAIRPDLIDLSLLGRQHVPGSGGRLALGEDAAEANAEHGQAINEAIIDGIIADARTLMDQTAQVPPSETLTYEATEQIWKDIRSTFPHWFAGSPLPGQPEVSTSSRWKPYEQISWLFG